MVIFNSYVKLPEGNSLFGKSNRLRHVNLLSLGPTNRAAMPQKKASWVVMLFHHFFISVPVLLVVLPLTQSYHVCLLKCTCCCLNMFKPNFVRSLARFNATRPSHRNDLPWISTHFLWGLLLAHEIWTCTRSVTDVPLQATVPTKIGKLLVMVPLY